MYIVPIIYENSQDHSAGWTSDYYQYLIPLYISCQAGEDGQFQPQTFPMIPRDILEPSGGNASLFTIATMDDYTSKLTSFQHQFAGQLDFSAFLLNSLEILNSVSPDMDEILAEAGVAVNSYLDTNSAINMQPGLVSKNTYTNPPRTILSEALSLVAWLLNIIIKLLYP